MQRRHLGLSMILLLSGSLGVGACRNNITHPIYRRPTITSIVAFPTVLGPGDSTVITLTATDPDGDSLVYDWDAYNGLILKGAPRITYIYSSPSPSMVFYRSPGYVSTYDTAFVYCSVRDQRGGSDSRRVIIVYQD